MGDDASPEVNALAHSFPAPLTGINRRRASGGLEWRLAQDPAAQ